MKRRLFKIDFLSKCSPECSDTIILSLVIDEEGMRTESYQCF